MVGRRNCSVILGNRVYKNEKFFERLMRTKSQAQKVDMLKDAKAEELLAIVEICMNILETDFPLTAKHRNKLVPHAPFIRKLSRARSIKSASNLVQTGRGVIISSLVIPVLFEIVRSLIKKSIN